MSSTDKYLKTRFVLISNSICMDDNNCALNINDNYEFQYLSKYDINYGTLLLSKYIDELNKESILILN